MPDRMPTLTEPSTLDAAYGLLRDSCGLVELEGNTSFSMLGIDRKGWLQGQATNDMRSLGLGRRLSFCLCKPTGQLEALSTVWETSNALHLTCNSDGFTSFEDRVKRFVILEDVRLEPFDGKVFSVQGPRATSELGAMMDLPALDAGYTTLKGKEVLCLRSDRTGVGGWDIWLPKNTRAPEKALRDAFPLVTLEAVAVAQLEAGIPRWNADIDSKTLPPELGEAFNGTHVSYSKGCYAGQEVLMRIHSRGHTNRTWMGLFVDDPVQVGDRILCRGNEAGAITSSAISPELGPIAAGYVRNQFAFNGEDVEVLVNGKRVGGELRSMPLLRLG